MDDLDIPFISEYCHWVIWNIPRLERIPENIPYNLAGGHLCKMRFRESLTEFIDTEQSKQPVFIRSTHRYRFTFYALNSYLELSKGQRSLM